MLTMWRNLFRRPPTDPSLFMVCGGRRTGTTLLAAMLSSDARANPLGQEAQILTRVVEAYRWGREHFDQFGQTLFGDLETYRLFFEETAARFAREASARISPGGVLILKNPELSRVLLDVAVLFPKAQFLATVRDPRDQIASEFEVGRRRLAAGDQVPHIEKRNVVFLATVYTAYFKEILELRRQQPERINIVRYEDLILRTDEILADLRAATGLALAFDPAKPWPRVSPLVAPFSGPSGTDLYGTAVNARSVGRFERDLSAEEIATVEAICAELMDEFGYPRPG